MGPMPAGLSSQMSPMGPMPDAIDDADVPPGAEAAI